MAKLSKVHKIITWKNRPEDIKKKKPVQQRLDVSQVNLTPGCVVFTACALRFEKIQNFSTLVRCTAKGADVKKGSMLLYIGQTRVTETLRIQGRPREVSMIKHVFLSDRGQCAIDDFNLVKFHIGNEDKHE